MKYGAKVTNKDDNAWKIWFKKNKYRKLDLLKPTKYEPLTAPEFWGNGKSH